MVFTRFNRIQFGNGDVSVIPSLVGTKENPQALILFQNREPTVIGKCELDKEYSQKGTVKYDPCRDIAFLFSRPESIDCVISALQVAKDLTFGDHNLVNKVLKDKDILIE